MPVSRLDKKGHICLDLPIQFVTSTAMLAGFSAKTCYKQRLRMILKIRKIDYVEWIEWALTELRHPLAKRFQPMSPCRVLVTKDELDLIIEAVTEQQAEKDWALSEDEALDDQPEERKTTQNEYEILTELLEFLSRYQKNPMEVSE